MIANEDDWGVADSVQAELHKSLYVVDRVHQAATVRLRVQISGRELLVLVDQARPTISSRRTLSLVSACPYN